MLDPLLPIIFSKTEQQPLHRTYSRRNAYHDDLYQTLQYKQQKTSQDIPKQLSKQVLYFALAPKYQDKPQRYAHMHAHTNKHIHKKQKKNSLQKPNKREHFKHPIHYLHTLKKNLLKTTRSQSTLYPMTKTPIRVMNTKQELEQLENIQQKKPKQNNQAFSCLLTRYPLRSLHTPPPAPPPPPPPPPPGGRKGEGRRKNDNKYLWEA